MKLNITNNYKKSSTVVADGETLKIGRDVFVYTVHSTDGSGKDLTAYKKSVTDGGREVQYENGHPLFWSTKVLGDVAEFEESVKDKGKFYVVEPLDLVSLRNLAETEQDPILKREFAKRYADAKISAYTLSKRSKKVAVAETAVVAEEGL